MLRIFSRSSKLRRARLAWNAEARCSGSFLLRAGLARDQVASPGIAAPRPVERPTTRHNGPRSTAALILPYNSPNADEPRHFPVSRSLHRRPVWGGSCVRRPPRHAPDRQRMPPATPDRPRNPRQPPPAPAGQRWPPRPQPQEPPGAPSGAHPRPARAPDQAP